MSGIVHLGVGAFFRAHAAVYLQDTFEKTGERWTVHGVSLRSPDVRDRLKAQAYHYTTLELSSDQSVAHTIKVIDSVLVAPENPAAVLKLMASPDTHIVSMTITEKGYCRGNSNGKLDMSNPDVLSDIKQPLPSTAPGYLVRALGQRWQQGIDPFTVLSLDNLPTNGHTTKAIVLDMAQRINPKLANWIDNKCRFPCTMVDRIVPATTQHDIDQLLQSHNINDRAMVSHEPFKQWVIEDNFVGNKRPDLAIAGTQLVNDVIPFELMKLRMLNGPHSALAYIGALKQHTTVADAMHDASIADFLNKLWELEIAPSLTAPPDISLNDYAAQLKTRFENTAIKHQLQQIAMDGSQKLPQRILDTLFENHANGKPCTRLISIVAAWVTYLQACSNGTCKHNINDPLSTTLTTVINQSGSNAELINGILAIDTVFGNYAVDKIAAKLIDAKQSIDDNGIDAHLRAPD